MIIKDKYLNSVPMYLRADKLDFSKVKSNLLVFNKNRASIDDLISNLDDYVSIYNRTNKHKRMKVVSTVYRIIDLKLAEHKTIDPNFVFLILHSLKSRYHFTEKDEQKNSILEDIEYAVTSYNPRNLIESNKYVDDGLLKYLRSRLKFSKSEQELVDWVEYHLPNCLHKFLAAIINRNSFISLKYLLCEECVISPEEKNKLYRFRRMILNKFDIIQEEEFDYLNHKSPTLTYGVYYARKLCEYLPHFNLSLFKDHQNYVNELFEKIKIIKKRKINYHYIKTLKLFGINRETNYNKIKSSIENVFNGYSFAELQLLGLYSIYNDATYDKLQFMAAYVDRRYRQYLQ